VGVVVRRRRLFVLLNQLFFWVVLVVALLMAFLSVPPPFYGEKFEGLPYFLFGDNWVLMILGIFVFNLVFSAFLIVTLPGLAFPLFSLAFLLYRAVVWGGLLAFASTSQFVVALPTLILEAEAYVLAAMSGTVLGLSWLKPERIYGSEGLSRREALGVAFKEAFHVYVLIAAILFFAAIVETITLLSVT